MDKTRNGLQLRPPPVLVPLRFGLALDLPSMVLALYLDRFGRRKWLEDDKQSTASTGVGHFLQKSIKKRTGILSFPQLDSLWMIFLCQPWQILASSCWFSGEQCFCTRLECWYCIVVEDLGEWECQIPLEMTNGFGWVSSDGPLQESPVEMLGVNFGLTWSTYIC